MRRYFALIWLLILTSILGCLFIEPVHAASVSVIVRLAAQVPTVTYDGQSEANGYAGLQDFNLNGPNSKNNGTPTAGDLEPIHAAGCMLKATVSDMAAALPMLASGGLAAPAEGLAGGLTAGADTAAEAGTAAADSGVWDLGPIARGNSIEQTLGANLPQNFPVIDQFANGTATSIKSIDLTGASYQNTATLASRLNGYVDSVAGFNGANWAGVNIDASEITARQLQLAVQPGAASAAQQAVINAAAARAQGMGVNFIVTPVP